MFGDLLGQSGQLQENMQKSLKEKAISVQREGLTISGNAAREILSVDISEDLAKDKDMLEDMLVVVFNSFLEEVAVIEAEESQKMIQSIIPPGFNM